jgi:hypothetical protein
MQRNMHGAWRIFVVAVVFAVMLAPQMALCFAQGQPDHACCATQPQMAAQPCCPNATPLAPTAAGSRASWASEFQASSAIFAFIQVEQLSVHPIARAMALPNSPPDTILRT